MHIVIVALVMDFSSLVLAEAVLSYVSIGVDLMMASFGTTINSARMELSREPMVCWSLVAAFAFMFSPSSPPTCWPTPCTTRLTRAVPVRAKSHLDPAGTNFCSYGQIPYRVQFNIT